MKIVVFAHSFPPEAHGGVPLSTFYLSRELISLGQEVVVITTNRNALGPIAVKRDCWTRYQGVPVIYCHAWPGPYVYCPTLGDIAKTEVADADIAISSSTLWNHMGLIARSVTKQYQVPHLVYLRGLLSPWALSFKRYRKILFWQLQGLRILSDASAIVALSAAEREAISKRGIDTPITVIPNGIRRSDYRESLSREELDCRFPQLRGKRFLLYMARVSLQKGLNELLPAFKQAIGESNELMLVLCGAVDPKFRKQLSQLIRDNALEANVILPGTVRGELKNSLLKFCSCFVLTSYAEGLSMSVLEALALACPVIISEQCNMPEVAQANAGWVVPNKVCDIQLAISQVLDNPAEAIRRGANARRLAEQSFSWGKVGRQAVRLCSSLHANSNYLEGADWRLGSVNE